MGDEYYGGQFDREYNLDDYTKYLKSKEAINTNQNRMQQWAGGPVKQQNKQRKGSVIQDRFMDAHNVSRNPNMLVNPVDQVPTEGPIFQENTNPRPNMQRSIGKSDGFNFNRLAGPIGALPMVAPEAVGMIGAAREAQQRGVNPMVNWLQRMTPVPVVAPTGNGGEVYNYQSGERYTPMY